MTSLNTTTDLSAGAVLAAGEYWIELVPASADQPHQISFPAVIESRRHHGLWVRPRLRPEVAQALCEWLNLVYPSNPDWYPLARIEDDLLIVFAGEAAHDRHQIALDVDGRYSLGDLGRWFLSGPTRTRARFHHRLDVLRDVGRHHPRTGETVVTCDPDNLPASGYPASIESCPGMTACVPVFRPEVAEAVAVTCSGNHDSFPEDHPQVYFDGNTLVHVHQHLRARDGYLPVRIDPDPDGNYRIDTPEWTFHIAPENPRESR